ncbi:uncharacterized protein B0J16DRAFT_403121 [Fusarium flagelliforme]|uniref:uncharacterized protein n=1 Tax=Fusarium flagelliforme TaxID=2675880 RepID=UPI001E8D6C38|nr:uncharacterized protein B0J16DRAFT_403121 [Fusarium flagelliforme]KAH7179833.1 hypothetical protein B0J16DRAFT_403121 [Fusarium flagelliforme]
MTTASSGAIAPYIIFTTKVGRGRARNVPISSIPHRLLVIALRRGIIEGTNTIDKLINGQYHYIMINREHPSKPIALGSKLRARLSTL